MTMVLIAKAYTPIVALVTYNLPHPPKKLDGGHI